MRIVAIGALHESFIDSMLEGHRKLRAHGGVAAIAELALLLAGKKEFRSGRAVNGMAVSAHDVALGVLAPPDVGAGKGLAVAAQAGVQHFFRRELGERARNRRLAAAGVHVVLAGPMAALAAG